jgi:Uma2 family endonuclease
VRELESQPGKRLTYDNGQLEIFMPLPPYERNKKYIARLVEIITMTLSIEICSLGASTWSRKDLAKGVEADECYYIQNEALLRGKMEIDLKILPPPDLAIEIDMTSLSLPRLPIYAALGIPEIWRFDGETMVFMALDNGQYHKILTSIALSIVTPKTLEHWLIQALTLGETSWVKAIRHWVRETTA